jgi:hypothetical protein
MDFNLSSTDSFALSLLPEEEEEEEGEQKSDRERALSLDLSAFSESYSLSPLSSSANSSTLTRAKLTTSLTSPRPVSLSTPLANSLSNPLSHSLSSSTSASISLSPSHSSASLAHAFLPPSHSLQPHPSQPPSSSLPSPSMGMPSNLRFAYMTRVSHDKYLVDGLSFKEKNILLSYAQHIEMTLSSSAGSSSSTPLPLTSTQSEFLTIESLHSVIENAKLVIIGLGKDNPPSHALIMVMLLLLRPIVPHELLKFPTIDHFFTTYPDFTSRNEREKNYLYENANWMNLLFRFLPAKVRKENSQID